jgi:hypothetical protein
MHTDVWPTTFRLTIMTTLHINTIKNKHFKRQYQWSYDGGLLLPLSN